MLTTIQIAGLQTFGYHGLFEEERSLGQKFTFDIDATLNPAPTHRDDRLDASIRYDAVVDAAVSLASGVANVVNHCGPVSNGAIPNAFIFQPAWYSNLGANAVVEQTFAADPLLSGWWRPNATNTNGQAAAAGNATCSRANASIAAAPSPAVGS